MMNRKTLTELTNLCLIYNTNNEILVEEKITKYGKKIVLTDTVGFISKLPHNLVDAFSSTLEEAKDADLILHVIDSFNLDRDKQIEVVEDVLKQNEITAPVIKVYNKCDLKEDVPKDGIAISAKKNIGIDKLKQAILEHME